MATEDQVRPVVTELLDSLWVVRKKDSRTGWATARKRGDRVRFTAPEVIHSRDKKRSAVAFNANTSVPQHLHALRAQSVGDRTIEIRVATNPACGVDSEVVVTEYREHAKRGFEFAEELGSGVNVFRAAIDEIARECDNVWLCRDGSFDCVFEIAWRYVWSVVKVA